MHERMKGMLNNTQSATQGGANSPVQDGYYNVKVVGIELTPDGRAYKVNGVIDDGTEEGKTVRGRLFNTAKAAWAMDKMKVSCGLEPKDDLNECINHIGRAKCGTDQGGYNNQILFWCNRANWKDAKQAPASKPSPKTQPKQEEPAKPLETWKITFATAVLAGNRDEALGVLKSAKACGLYNGEDVPKLLQQTESATYQARPDYEPPAPTDEDAPSEYDDYYDDIEASAGTMIHDNAIYLDTDDLPF